MSDHALAAAVGSAFSHHGLDDEALLGELGARRVADG
jgi:hypothetical protein